MERTTPETPRVLIENLRERNEKEFAYGFLMFVPVEGGRHAAFLLPVQVKSETFERVSGGNYRQDFYGAYGVHPDRGLVYIDGDAAKDLSDFSEDAIKANSISDPKEIIFPIPLEDLLQKHSEDWRSRLFNLPDVDGGEPVNRSPGVRLSWREAHNKALEHMSRYMESVGVRKTGLRQAAEILAGRR